MSGFIHSSVFRTPSSWVKSGEDANFPATNAGIYWAPHRPWKSDTNVTSGTTYIGADFGSAVELAAVAVDNLNISSVKIQAATDSAFSVSVIDSGAINISRQLVERSLFSDTSNVPLARRKLFYNCTGTGFAGQSRRYWRVLANTSTPITGSADKMFVGSIVWCATINTWSAGTGSYEETPIEATIPNDTFAGGGAAPVILGNPHGIVTLGATPAQRSTMRDTVLTLLREGIGRWVVFYRNDGDTADFYIARRAADVTIRQTSPDSIEFAQLILQGAV